MPIFYVLHGNEQNFRNIDMIYGLRATNQTIYFLTPSQEINITVYFVMPRANCGVISSQNKKIKLKHLINNKRTVTQKYKRTCITVLKVLSHYVIKIFVS